MGYWGRREHPWISLSLSFPLKIIEIPKRMRKRNASFLKIRNPHSVRFDLNFFMRNQMFQTWQKLITLPRLMSSLCSQRQHHQGGNIKPFHPGSHTFINMYVSVRDWWEAMAHELHFCSPLILYYMPAVGLIFAEHSCVPVDMCEMHLRRPKVNLETSFF